MAAEDVHRCIGYFPSYEEAVASVKANQGEMHECRYNYAVIEEIPSGVWQRTIEENWFYWNGEHRSWFGCTKPSQYKTSCNVTGFSMG